MIGRDRLQLVVVLDLREHLAAVHLGQVEVQQDEVRAVALGVRLLPFQERHRLVAVRDDGQVDVASWPRRGLRASDARRLGCLRPGARRSTCRHLRSDHAAPSAASRVNRNVDPSPACDSTEMVAAVPLDDLLADRQADAGAGELVSLVQPLEHAEDPLEVLRVDPQPVVLHREEPLPVAVLRGRDVHLGVPGRWYLIALPTRFWNSWISCISSARTCGQRIVGDDGAAVLDGAAEVRERLQERRLRWRSRAAPVPWSRRARRPAGPGSAAACGWPRRPRTR